MESTDMNKPGMPEPAENAKVPEEMSTLAGSVKLSVEQLDEMVGGKTGGSSISPDNMGLNVKISKGQLPYLLKTIFRIKGDAGDR